MMPYPLTGNRALRLTATIDTEGLSPSDLELLERHADAPQGRIQREFLVPERMRLHNLHYALQQSFGWHNTRMHAFSLPQEAFERITANRFTDWALLVGIYFRFPDAPPDSYYHGDMHPDDSNYRAWMRRRYSGPYDWDIGAFFEHLVSAKLLLQPYLVKDAGGEDEEEEAEAEEVDQQVFHEEVAGIRRLIAQIEDVRNLTVSEAQQLFHGNMNELLERIPVGELLIPETVEMPGQREIDRLIGNGEVAFALGQHYTYPITVELAERAYQYHDNRAPLDVLEIQDRYERTMTQTDLPVQPAANGLRYVYDPGHNWAINIECIERYEMPDYVPGMYNDDWPIQDSQGRKVDTATYAMAHHVIVNNRPVVLTAQGTNVPADISGLIDFLHFLRRYTGADPRVRAEAVAWARGRGWNPEVPDPRGIL